MPFWMRLRLVAVSTTAFTICPTRTTTSHCRQAGFFLFALRRPKPDSFTVATYTQAVLRLASLRGFASRDFSWYYSLFVVFSFTIWFFSTAVCIWRAGNMTITLLRLRKNGKCKTSTRWQWLFRLTIHVGFDLLYEGNQIMLSFWHASLFTNFWLHRLVQPCKKELNFYPGKIVVFNPDLCFEGIESSEERIVWLVRCFFGLQLIKLCSMDPMGTISSTSIQKIFEGNQVFVGVLFHLVVVSTINFLNNK